MKQTLVLKTVVRPAELAGQTEVVAMSSRKVELLQSKGLMGANFNSAKGVTSTFSMPKY
jgi:hypothetical protein